MRKKANMFLIFSILVSLYLLYGISVTIQKIGSYKMLDYVVIIILNALLITLDIFLFKKYKFCRKPENLEKEMDSEKERKTLEVSISKAKVEKLKLVPGSKERMGLLGATLNISAKHMAGLPIAEDAFVYIYLCNNKIIFERNETTYNLPFEKIKDITIKTDIDIQKFYVSSIGGAVGGAVLFGPLGAIIGGRSKQKQSKTTNNYLIFTYDKDDKIDFISFDVTGIVKAHQFVEIFNKIPKNSKEINL